ncbi:MAG: hypothetical protein IH866_03795 [Chloroflexi bacterium]|nr:hypothetical protein [Chloroflexota bacterium]
MRPTATVRQTLISAARPAALAAIAVALAVVSSLSLSTDSAHAQPVIEVEGACEPSPVRPNEPALISCTVRITNAGDVTATSLVGNIFIAGGCDIPSRFSFIDRTVDGVLVATAPLGLSVEIGDLAPGESVESVTRIATENFAPGRSGGSLTVRSLDDPALNAVIDLCWDVDASAAAPPANLIVTKTLVSESPLRPINPIPVLAPPLLLAGDTPVGIEPLPVPLPPPGLDEATYEIVVTNVSDVEIGGVTLLDAQLGGAVLAGAEPPATGADPLGRPTWELGALAAGDEARVLVTFGAPPDGNCANADDVAIVSATPAGGEREEYLAFADLGGPVGQCEFFQTSFCLHYPPGEGFEIGAPCEIDVCWAESPDGGELRSVFDCNADIDYCWFLPPGEGFTALRPCADDVCWVSFGGFVLEDEAFGDPREYLSEFPCEIEFCQFTAPDGVYNVRNECAFPTCWTMPPGSTEWQNYYDCSGTTDTCWFTPPDGGEPALFPCSQDICWQSFGDSDFSFASPCGERGSVCLITAPDGITTSIGSCDAPSCWSSPPEGGDWQQVYDCGEFETWCWFSPPAQSGGSVLNPCGSPIRFAVNPPPGAIDIGFGALPVFDEGDLCWPVPLSDGPFITFPIACDQVEFISWFTPPDGGPKVPGFGLIYACLEPLPPDADLPPDGIIPPDLLIPGPCPPGEEPTIGEPGTSIPAEVVDGVSTPAEVVPGTVEEIAPLPSASVTPAEIVAGTVEVLETLRSAEIIPAVLLPSSRVEQGEGEGPIILPIDGVTPRGPGDGPDGGNIIDDTTDSDDTTGPDETREETIVKTLPDAGTGGVSGDSGAWPAAFGLAAAAALAATLGVAIRQRGRL